jgi:aromatic ring-opening dioxygenase catalytic subunit (LigB family)
MLIHCPQEHIRMGEALAPLREEGVAILGSGSSFHNMQGLFAAMGDPAGATSVARQARQRSKRFDAWLQHACTSPELSFEQRGELLAGWRQAPEAEYSHPREEHLLPLHVAFGAGGGQSAFLYSGLAMGVKCSSVQWL